MAQKNKNQLHTLNKSLSYQIRNEKVIALRAFLFFISNFLFRDIRLRWSNG